MDPCSVIPCCCDTHDQPRSPPPTTTTIINFITGRCNPKRDGRVGGKAKRHITATEGNAKKMRHQLLSYLFHHLPLSSFPSVPVPALPTIGPPITVSHPVTTPRPYPSSPKPSIQASSQECPESPQMSSARLPAQTRQTTPEEAPESETPDPAPDPHRRFFARLCIHPR